MAFDIYQQVFDRDGVPVEKKAGAYIDRLMELFVQSPEGQQLLSEEMEPGWASMMMDFGNRKQESVSPCVSGGSNDVQT